MKKVVTKPMDVVTYTCDACGKETTGDKCVICGKDICMDCSCEGEQEVCLSHIEDYKKYMPQWSWIELQHLDPYNFPSMEMNKDSWILLFVTEDDWNKLMVFDSMEKLLEEVNAGADVYFAGGEYGGDYVAVFHDNCQFEVEPSYTITKTGRQFD